MRLIAITMFALFVAILLLLADAHTKNRTPLSASAPTAENQNAILAATH